MTFLLETIRLGLTNLRLHAMRSFLTALGIILGVSAVIVMVAIGEGSKREALLRIERLGAKNIIVRSQRPPESAQQTSGQSRSFVSKYGLTRPDLEVIRANFPDADAIVPLKEVGSQVIRGERRVTSQAYGTTPELRHVAILDVQPGGRYLTASDIDNVASVAVIGQEIAKTLFPWDEPLGNTLRIDDKSFVVVGVLRPVGLAGGAGGALVGHDFNSDVHIPITTARQVFSDTVFRRSSGQFQASEVQVGELYVAAPDRERVIEYSDRLKRILAVRHENQNDFSIIVPFELLQEARRAAMTWQGVLAAIAGISLLVGGIGIMNIMLATVTERTREIGVRRALGATRKHITWQFLVETGVLSSIGGLIGVGLGVGGSFLLTWGLPQFAKLPYIGSLIPPSYTMPTQVTMWSVVLAFAVAAATGLVFGLYPARKAARQDPIVALRHD